MTDRKGWGKVKERERKSRKEKTYKDRKGQEERGGVKEKGKERNRELVGCGLPISNFHILPIATPKSLIVWPQTKYCRDHSTPASRRLAAENLAV